MLKNLVTRQLLKSNQIGTSILYGIANKHNCFKIQFSVCIDNFEQYFQASILKTQNDLESFIITWKVFTPLKSSRLKLSVWFPDFWICSTAKNLKIRKRRKSTDSFVKQRIPMANICNYLENYNFALSVTVVFLRAFKGSCKNESNTDISY